MDYSGKDLSLVKNVALVEVPWTGYFTRYSKYDTLAELIGYVQHCCKVGGWIQCAGAYLKDPSRHFYYILDSNFEKVLLHGYGLPAQWNKKERD